MRRTLAFALLIAALLIAGCTTTVAGSAQPAFARAGVAPVRHLDPNHITSTDALGDLTTVNACSLLDQEALAKDYGAYQLIAADTIDDCALLVRTPDGRSVTAIIGTVEVLSRMMLHATRTLPRTGGTRIIVGRDDGTRCDSVLAFADDAALSSVVLPTGGGGSGTGMCDVAIKLLDQAVATITGPGPRHRDYPDYSLSGMKACDLLGDAEVRLAAVGDVHSRGEFPADHRCLYTDPRDRTAGQVELDFSERAPSRIPPQWTQVQLSAHDSWVIPDPSPGNSAYTYCIVEMDWLNLADAGPAHASEAAALTVRVPNGEPIPCDKAKKVATAVWKKLP